MSPSDSLREANKRPTSSAGWRLAGLAFGVNAGFQAYVLQRLYKDCMSNRLITDMTIFRVPLVLSLLYVGGMSSVLAFPRKPWSLQKAFLSGGIGGAVSLFIALADIITGYI